MDSTAENEGEGEIAKVRARARARERKAKGNVESDLPAESMAYLRTRWRLDPRFLGRKCLSLNETP